MEEMEMVEEMPEPEITAPEAEPREVKDSR